MITLTERTIMKSRSGVYSDTSENRRKHRVGQKYGADKQPEDDEKNEKKEADPEKELEAVNKVIAAINEGKLNLPASEVMKLSEKKQKLEAAMKQAEKINAGVKANEEKKNAKEVKETNKKIDEASKQKKYGDMNVEEAKKELLGKDLTITDIETGKTRTEKITSILIGSVRGHETVMARVEGGGTYPIKQINTGKAWKAWKLSLASETKEPEKKEESSSKKYSEMDIKEARKELLGKKITFKEYFFDGVDSYKDAVGEIKQVRLYGKEKQPVLSADFPNGDSVQISLKQLDERKVLKYEIVFDEKVGEEKTEKKEEPLEGKEFFTVSESDVKNLKKEFDNVLNGVDLSKQNSDDIKETLRGIASDFLKKNYEEAENKAAKAGNRDFNLLNSQRDKASENIIFDYISNLNLNKRKVNLDEDKGSSTVKEKVQEEPKKEETTKEESKSEPKQGETEESYTRVKFDDVPNSGKVNLKKYLSDKVRNQADENLGVLSKVSFENLQTMEKGLVKEFNSQFGSLSKSRRAEKLYSIMKVKSELENRKQEESKKYQKYTSSLDDNTLLSIGYDLGEEIRKLSSRGFSTLEQQQEVLKKISELSVKRQINEDEQRKRMDKLNNSPDEITTK